MALASPSQHPFLEPHELAGGHPAVVLSKILHGHLPRWLVDREDSATSDLLLHV